MVRAACPPVLMGALQESLDQIHQGWDTVFTHQLSPIFILVLLDSACNCLLDVFLESSHDY